LQAGTRPVPQADAVDKMAWQVDGGVGIAPVKGFRIGLGGLAASGDDDPMDDKDNAWDPLFPTSHKFLGWADVFGERTNAVSGILDIGYKVNDAVALKLMGHYLARMEENAEGETYQGSE